MKLEPISESLVNQIRDFVKSKTNDSEKCGDCWHEDGDYEAYDLLNEVLLHSTGEEV